MSDDKIIRDGATVFATSGCLLCATAAFGHIHHQALIIGAPITIWGAFFAAGGIRKMIDWRWDSLPVFAACLFPNWAIPLCAAIYYGNQSFFDSLAR